ncbi:MAG: DUF481 domain-containing protein [Gammaproteobacteria bacterium]|nr:DUF481 domain-containing protein [Gammaproteobacteria bacterium]
MAIVNIENIRVQSSEKTEGVDKKLSLDISGKNGNTQKQKVGLGGRVQWYEKEATRFIVVNYEYGESADVKDTNKTFVHLRNIQYQSKSFAWESFVQLTTDEFSRLDSRMLLGGGVRLNLLNSDDKSVALGLGVFREREKLNFVPLTTDEGVVYNNRMNSYLVYKRALSNHSRFSSTLYYQPALNKISDYRLFEQLSLQLDITENLSFNLSVDITHDSEPAQLTKGTDTTYNTGFEYSF